MKRLFLVAAITSLVATMASISWAAANLNLSKSNINRVIYSTGGMTSTQAAAFVAELDKTPRVDEAAVRKALQKLFIPTNFKLIRIINPPSVPPANQLRAAKPPITVLLLTNPAQEAEAMRIAVSDPGMPAGKRVAPSIPPASSK
jgi:hypothetical protein